MALSKTAFNQALFANLVNRLGESGILMPPEVMESFLVLLRTKLSLALEDTFSNFSKDFEKDES